MKIQSAIAKGKQLENFIVEELRSSGLDTRAMRNPGSGNGKNKGDVWNDLNLAFEAKNTKNFHINQFFEQATKQGLGTQHPVVVWHPPHKPLEDSIVVINWYHFKDLLLKIKNSMPAYENPDRNANWVLENLKNAIKKVQKELNI